MAFPRIGGSNVPLDCGDLAQPLFGYLYAGGGINTIDLAAGEYMYIPSGTYEVTPGPYTQLQFRDPITGAWRSQQSVGNSSRVVGSDGYNWRLANLTGCAIGAFITNVGSGYTSAPTVTASAGASTWTPIVGGAINATVTITNAGAGYGYPPILFISPPPAGGIQATAHCTLSGGTIGSVVVDNQGAGYAVAPTILVFPDPRDVASGAITTTAVLTVNATLAGAGTITGLLVGNHGTPLTAVPTLSFTGGGGSSAAATAVMCFTATGFTVGTGGAAYGNAQPFLVITGGGIVGGSAGATINPQLSSNLTTPRQANISGTSTAGGAITATGAIVNDGGLFQAVPQGFVIASGTGALPTTTGIVTITVGGVTDYSLLQPI